MWSSDKLHACPMWARREYPWLYALADAFGNFELNVRVIASKLHPNRPDLREKKLGDIFAELNKHGLAFIWSKNGKSYVHWSGSEAPGRLPTASRRSKRYERQLSPPIPQKEYQSYLQTFRENSSVQQPNESLRSALAFASASASASEKPAQASPSLRWFDDFWRAYPRKVGKPAARTAWGRLKNADDEPLMAGIERWKQTEQWQKEGGKFIPYPATFLNQRRWEDEPPNADPNPSSTAANFKPGKCRACGAETAPGFIKCHVCIQKDTGRTHETIE